MSDPRVLVHPRLLALFESVADTQRVILDLVDDAEIPRCGVTGLALLMAGYQELAESGVPASDIRGILATLSDQAQNTIELAMLNALDDVPGPAA